MPLWLEIDESKLTPVCFLSHAIKHRQSLLDRCRRCSDEAFEQGAFGNFKINAYERSIAPLLTIMAHNWKK
jgi:hypothetical protein